MFEPIIFPKTTSCVPFSVTTVPEIMLTTNSGAEVPMATMVNPMAMSETLNLLAREDAPLTSKSAPFIRRKKPIMIRRKLIVTSKGASVSC